jgi:hypothetical protein
MKTKLIILSIASISLFGCKKFDKFNDNQNAPENVNPQFLLSNVLATASDNQAYWGWHAGSLLAQHSSNLEFLPVDRYDLGSNSGLWDQTYRLLNDLKTIENSEEGNDAYQAVSWILKAHQTALLTDLWANVPYYNALKGQSDGIFSPEFDSQEAIYMNEGGIIDLLEKAAVQLENSTSTISGDLMYNGDLNKWIRFANSLRVRYLVRVSGKVDVSVKLQQIVDDGMIFTGNTDHAVVPYLSSSPNQWAIFQEREGRYTDVRMSTTAETILSGLSDPRIGVYYKPTVNSLGGSPVYTGIPNGLSRESQNTYNLNDVSLMGSILRDVPDGITANFMTYAELQFCLAEAVQKGIIGGSATTYYNQGIQAAFDAYSVTLPTSYLTDAAVMLDGTEDLKRIMTQKWIALFMNGYEAWIDVRRTGYPVLPIPADNLNSNVFPVRYTYPSTEQAVNGTNYASAVAMIGGDTYNSMGWWEQ